MMAYTMNNEKKAMRELNLEELEIIVGGVGYKNINGEVWVEWIDGTQLPLEDNVDLLEMFYDECYRTSGGHNAYDATLEFMNECIPDPHNAERLLGGFNYVRETIKGKVLNWDGTARSRYTIGS